jgi:very-short-patch-repair endonuclease
MRFLKNDPTLKDRRRELRQSQTEAEKSFWGQVRNKRFMGLKFFRQYSVGQYILDFYCPEIRLAVELDGGQHNEPEQREYDAARTDYLHAHGIRVLRFWNHEVMSEMEGVLMRMEAECNPSCPPP